MSDEERRWQSRAMMDAFALYRGTASCIYEPAFALTVERKMLHLMGPMMRKARRVRTRAGFFRFRRALRRLQGVGDKAKPRKAP